MALDNIELDNLQAGDDVITDLIATDHYQIVKHAFGAAGTANLVTSTATNPLPVALSDTDNAVLDDIAAQNTTVAGAVAAGQMQVDIVADGAGLLTTAVHNGALGVAGTADAQVRSVQGIASMTPLLVDATGQGDVPITLAGEAVVLGAGSAAIGKLAANTGVDIGDVDILSIAAGDNNIGNVDIASALPAGTNAIGKLAANSGVDIGDVDVLSSALPSGAATSANQLPATSGGISTVYRDEDIDETAVALKAGAGQIYWIHCVNFDATPVYLHFYDVAQGSVTVGTTGELCSFAVPSQGDANGAGFTMHFNHGIEFGTAITIACTTAISGSAGPGANEVIVNVGYE